MKMIVFYVEKYGQEEPQPVIYRYSTGRGDPGDWMRNTLKDSASEGVYSYDAEADIKVWYPPGKILHAEVWE